MSNGSKLKQVTGNDLDRAGRDELVTHDIVHDGEFGIGVDTDFLEVELDTG